MKDPQQSFQLAVWDEDHEAVLPASEYLAGLRAGSLQWQTDLDSSSLIIRAEGQEWFDENNYGPLGTLVHQLEAAHARLAAGKLVAVRTAFWDAFPPEVLLFEPHGAEIRLTAVTIQTAPYDSYFPIDRDGPTSVPFYAYLRDQRESLEVEWGPVVFSRDLLLASLAEEAQHGRAIASHFGSPIGTAPSFPLE